MALRFVVFFAVVLSIVGSIHFYFWSRLVRQTALPFPYRAWASGLVVALAVMLPLSLILVRRLPPAWSRSLAWVGFTWLGVMFLLFAALVATDLVRLGLLLVDRVTGAEALLDPARRTLLARLLGAAAGAAAGLTGGVALGNGLREPIIREINVKLHLLSPRHHGLTIVQLTDVHVGPTIGRAFIEDLVRRTNALGADIVAITGDLVDGSVEALWASVEPLRELKARLGVYFVTGNHEYFSGVRPWMEALGRLGIKVLANERVTLDGPDGLDLAGVHDYSGGRQDPALAPDLARALAGRDPARPLVLLAHQPRAVHEAAAQGVGLVLSGHTHGGQIWPWNHLVKLQQPYVEGLHRHGGGETQIYVSPGTGYWGPPMRLGTRAEITRITLARAES